MVPSTAFYRRKRRNFPLARIFYHFYYIRNPGLARMLRDRSLRMALLFPKKEKVTSTNAIDGTSHAIRRADHRPRTGNFRLRTSVRFGGNRANERSIHFLRSFCALAELEMRWRQRTACEILEQPLRQRFHSYRRYASIFWGVCIKAFDTESHTIFRPLLFGNLFRAIPHPHFDHGSLPLSAAIRYSYKRPRFSPIVYGTCPIERLSSGTF